MINISIGKQMYHENERKKIVEIYHPNWQFDTRVDLVNSFWHQIIQQSFRGKNQSRINDTDTETASKIILSFNVNANVTRNNFVHSLSIFVL